MGFDKARRAGDALQIIKNGIETLNVTDLQHAFIFAREPNQLGSLHGGIGHWFFYEHVTTRTQELAGQIKMRNCRRDDVHRIGHSDGSF